MAARFPQEEKSQRLILYGLKGQARVTSLSCTRSDAQLHHVATLTFAMKIKKIRGSSTSFLLSQSCQFTTQLLSFSSRSLKHFAKVSVP